MIELYEIPPTRSQRVKWVLEELGLEYSSHVLDARNSDLNSGSYRKIHPLGVVPALKTNSYTIFESVAIVLQLIDEHPEMNLAPAIGTAERAKYYQWSIFTCAEMDPPLMMFFDNSMRPLEFMHPPGSQYDPKHAEKGRNDFAVRADILSDVLSNQDYILGAEFSGADVLVGHSCFMAMHMGLLGTFPILEAYYERLQQRPAHQRAYGVVEEQ